MTQMDEKPFSPACERNQKVILENEQKWLRPTDKHILEIGSGTGQHAVYFGQNLPHITWQTSDVMDNHAGIDMWLAESAAENVKSPLTYEIGRHKFPTVNADVVFSANTLHIISEDLVKQLIVDLGESLKPACRVMFYGPFKYRGEFTSQSNAEFDLWLQDVDPLRGVRDFESIHDLMRQQNFVMITDVTMPANNQLLLFEKQPSST